MKIATIIIRTLLGLMFFASGVVAFLPIEMPLPKPELAAEFVKVLAGSHYLYAIKSFEVVGGFILLTGRYTPLGLTLVGPVIVNILFFDIFLDRSGLLMGLVIAAMALFLLWRNGNAFAGLVRK